jgi:hypothetical protein
VRSNLKFDSRQAFAIYDGHELRTCPNTAAAIATVGTGQAAVLGCRSVRDPHGS